MHSFLFTTPFVICVLGIFDPFELVLCFINRLQIYCRKNVLVPIWYRVESCCIYINWQNVSGLVSVKLSRMGHLLTSNIKFIGVSKFICSSWDLITNRFITPHCIVDLLKLCVICFISMSSAMIKRINLSAYIKIYDTTTSDKADTIII